MKYTHEQLETIKKLAAICMKPTEIAITIDVPEEILKSDISMSGHPARTAYLQGKISTKTELHRNMVEFARVCSPAAISMLSNAILDMEDDE